MDKSKINLVLNPNLKKIDFYIKNKCFLKRNNFQFIITKYNDSTMFEENIAPRDMEVKNSNKLILLNKVYEHCRTIIFNKTSQFITCLEPQILFSYYSDTKYALLNAKREEWKNGFIDLGYIRHSHQIYENLSIIYSTERINNVTICSLNLCNLFREKIYQRSKCENPLLDLITYKTKRNNSKIIYFFQICTKAADHIVKYKLHPTSVPPYFEQIANYNQPSCLLSTYPKLNLLLPIEEAYFLVSSQLAIYYIYKEEEIELIKEPAISNVNEFEYIGNMKFLLFIDNKIQIYDIRKDKFYPSMDMGIHRRFFVHKYIHIRCYKDILIIIINPGKVLRISLSSKESNLINAYPYINDEYYILHIC